MGFIFKVVYLENSDPVAFYSPSWKINLAGVFQDANLCVPTGSLSPAPFWNGSTTSWCFPALAESGIVCTAFEKCFAFKNLSLILTEEQMGPAKALS